MLNDALFLEGRSSESEVKIMEISFTLVNNEDVCVDLTPIFRKDIFSVKSLQEKIYKDFGTSFENLNYIYVKEKGHSFRIDEYFYKSGDFEGLFKVLEKLWGLSVDALEHLEAYQEFSEECLEGCLACFENHEYRSGITMSKLARDLAEVMFATYNVPTFISLFFDYDEFEYALGEEWQETYWGVIRKLGN